jgi:hypothetical protein
MTKKDYELLAKSLRSVRPKELRRGYPTVHLLYRARLDEWGKYIEAISAALENDNDLFDPKRFLRAAGWDPNNINEEKSS